MPEPGSAPYEKPSVKGQLRTRAGTKDVSLPVVLKMHGASSLAD